MTTPLQDPTFQPGCYVFGYTVFGLGLFGNARTYPQQSLFGSDIFGNMVPGKNTEDDVFTFIHGAPVPREKGPWAVTSDMSARVQGSWAKRVIYQIRKGKQVARRYTPYDGSPKTYLVQYQPKFNTAITLWKALSPGQKQRLNSDASRLGLRYSGYNYFISLYLLSNPKWVTYI